MDRPLLLHVLGGGPWQVPTVKLAREMGHRVLVTDMYRERPAHAWTDCHEVVDITDAQATLAAARRHRVDGVICDTTDFGVATAAYVAEQLGLPGSGHDTALNFTDKARMRARTVAAGLAAPRFRAVSSVADLADAIAATGLPAVLKPVDNQSGRGVRVVRTWDQAAQAFSQASKLSRSGWVLVEERLVGLEVIVDGLVVDGTAHALSMACKTAYDDNPTLGRRILYPEQDRLPVDATTLRSCCESTLQALGLASGLFHAEFIVRDGRPIPIDIAARGGGVHIYRVVVPHVSGVDANRAAIELALGQRPRVNPRPVPRCANIEFLRMPEGQLEAVEGIDAARAVPGIAAVVLNVSPGDRLVAPANKDQRPGYIVALADRSDAAIEACLRAKSLIGVRMDGVARTISVT